MTSREGSHPVSNRMGECAKAPWSQETPAASSGSGSLARIPRPGRRILAAVTARRMIRVPVVRRTMGGSAKGFGFRWHRLHPSGTSSDSVERTHTRSPHLSPYGSYGFGFRWHRLHPSRLSSDSVVRQTAPSGFPDGGFVLTNIVIRASTGRRKRGAAAERALIPIKIPQCWHNRRTLGRAVRSLKRPSVPSPGHSIVRALRATGLALFAPAT